MAFNVQDWLGNLSGYKPRYDALAADFDKLEWEVDEAEALVDQLLEALGMVTSGGLRDKLSYILTKADAFDNYPIPTPPVIDFEVIRSGSWVTANVADIVAGGMRYYQLDSEYRLTNQVNWVNIILWEWSDQKDYIAEWWDCENFAVSFWLHCNMYLKMNSCAFVFDYKSGHGYDIILYADTKKALLEPQTDTVMALTTRNMSMYSLGGGMFAM